jgi:hypothetical protein
MLERFGLAGAGKRIALDFLDQLYNAGRCQQRCRLFRRSSLLSSFLNTFNSRLGVAGTDLVVKGQDERLSSPLTTRSVPALR